ncbi:MAG: MoaD/ThiS family protein [Alcanivoracaceae bacterium]|nr:MoaD/ThiS family protein [Alcanivoracaceae bacterium]
MKITLLFFARFRQCLGVDQETVDAAPGSTVADVINALAERGGVWQQVFDGDASVMVAINERMATRESGLHDGDTLALFPPVTGG